jgi:hypothetical protein
VRTRSSVNRTKVTTAAMACIKAILGPRSV